MVEEKRNGRERKLGVMCPVPILRTIAFVHREHKHFLKIYAAMLHSSVVLN